jgi:hypothetical protein
VECWVVAADVVHRCVARPACGGFRPPGGWLAVLTGGRRPARRMRASGPQVSERERFSRSVSVKSVMLEGVNPSDARTSRGAEIDVRIT